MRQQAMPPYARNSLCHLTATSGRRTTTHRSCHAPVMFRPFRGVRRIRPRLRSSGAGNRTNKSCKIREWRTSAGQCLRGERRGWRFEEKNSTATKPLAPFGGCARANAGTRLARSANPGLSVFSPSADALRRLPAESSGQIWKAGALDPNMRKQPQASELPEVDIYQYFHFRGA